MVDQAGLKQTRSTIPENTFLRDGAHIKCKCTNLTNQKKKKHHKNSTRNSCRCARVAALKSLPVHRYSVVISTFAGPFGNVGFSTYLRADGARRREECRICHGLNKTESAVFKLWLLYFQRILFNR